MKNHFYLFIGVIGILILAALLLLIQKGNTIQAPCLLLPESEWILSHESPGEVYSRLICNSPPQVQEFKLLLAERSDLIDFSLVDKIERDKPVNKGAVIGFAISIENHFRVAELQTKLDLEESRLHVISTGEKSPIQEEYQKTYEYAVAESEAYNQIYERNQKLFAQNLISTEVWQTCELQKRLLDIKVSLAKARLLTVQSGLKTEEVNMVKNNIAHLIDQLSWLQKKIEAEKIQSPLDGHFADTAVPGVICKVVDYKTIVLHIPVSLSVVNNIDIGNDIQVEVLLKSPVQKHTKVVSIGSETQLIGNRGMILVTGRIDNQDLSIRPGSRAFVRIRCSRVRVMDRFRNSLSMIKIRL